MRDSHVSFGVSAPRSKNSDFGRNVRMRASVLECGASAPLFGATNRPTRYPFAFAQPDFN
jgi:hypothetical protein